MEKSGHYKNYGEVCDKYFRRYTEVLGRPRVLDIVAQELRNNWINDTLLVTPDDLSRIEERLKAEASKA